MNVFGNVLLLGTGPVAIQLAVMLKNQLNCTIGIAGRPSSRSAQLMDALEKSGGVVEFIFRTNSITAWQGNAGWIIDIPDI